MAAEAEAALNALKKREANKSCANCGSYNKFGHQNVCEKPRTFVCSNCKSAHQSFSMRVKSVSMSNWTMAEVDALRDENGGGNAAAARVWLARWDETQMRKPTAQDPLDYYKQFINRVYNDKAFYDEAGASSNSASTAAERSPSRSPEGRRAAPAVNLLDFDAAPAAPKQPEVASFDAFSGSQWTANSSSNAADWGNFAAAPVAPHSSPNDGFAAFSAAPTPSDGFANFSAAPAATPTPAASTEVFGAFASAPVAPSTPSFDPFAASGGGLLAATAPSSGGFGSVAPAPAPVPFDPFAPVAGNSGKSTTSGFGQFQSAAPKDFAAFDGLSAPSLAYGAPQNTAGNGYGHGQNHNGMGMQGHGQRMQTHAPGFQQPHYPPQQQQYQPQMMGGGNAAMNISTFFAPNGVAVGGGNAGPRPNGRDPFAGLGLPQH